MKEILCLAQRNEGKPNQFWIQYGLSYEEYWINYKLDFRSQFECWAVLLFRLF